MRRPPNHGIARVLSKRGLCSRSEAARWVLEGRVSVDGRVVRNPEHPVLQGGARVEVDGRTIDTPTPIHLMLNKPRGLVTTARDERDRATVYRCLEGADLPWLAPVGRLDKASEGLLLFSNDPGWAARISDPAGPGKTYHVQIDTIPGDTTLRAFERGMQCEGEWLRAKSAALLRSGGKNAWIEILLDEGRNRHIRRLLAAFDIRVLRLVRVAVGALALGDLGKGQWRMLSEQEAASLVRSEVHSTTTRDHIR